MVLSVLCMAALLVYGVPYVVERVSYAWAAGRARADSEALAKLDKEGIVNRASIASVSCMATNAVSPAVVNVQSLRQPLGGGDGFAGLGGNCLGPRFEGAELGSGVIIDKDRGFVVTNNHVIKDADQILVRLGPGDDVPARVVGADVKLDLAVLQVKPNLTVQAEWGDSEQLDIGDWVLAIGSPMGFDHSVTAGIVSATERNDVRISEFQSSFIQTDAAINPGNSGGPLINLAGKVVGINTAIITKSGGYEGIGLAIPSTLARRVVEDLIKSGKFIRGYLGVIIQPVDSSQVEKLKLPNRRGALVSAVQPGSPAERAGLQSNDVIVNLAEHDVADPAALRNLTTGLAVGREVSLSFYRGGEQRTTKVSIAPLPPVPEVVLLFGFSVRESPAGQKGNGHSIEIDQVVPGSPAFHEGLRQGICILGVGERPEPVTTLAESEVAVHKLDQSRGLFLVAEANGQMFRFRLPTALEKPQP